MVARCPLEIIASIGGCGRPCRSSVTRQRRKLKKQAALVAKGVMTVEQVNQSYQSWRGSMKRLNAHEMVKRMDALYKELFG